MAGVPSNGSGAGSTDPRESLTEELLAAVDRTLARRRTVPDALVADVRAMGDGVPNQREHG